MHRSNVKSAPLLMLAIAACAPAGPPSVSGSPEPDACVLEPGAGSAPDTLIVAVGDSIRDTRAPVPRNDAERLAFRQAYATLLRIDCAGRLQPGLAAEWSADSTRTVWSLRLRDVELDDGTVLSARDVIESWARHGLADRRPWLREVVAESDRTLVVTFTAPEPAGPFALADPALAVGVPRAGGQWPEATGQFRFESESVAVLRSGESRRVMRFRRTNGRDLRDLIAEGADLAITSDPGAIAYAKGLPQYEVAPLPWSRTYLLVSPTAPPLDTGPDSTSRRRFREALARDAVFVDARGAEPPFAWETAFACRTGFSATSRPSRRVVFPESDATARSLAERMVAIAGAANLVATGLPEDALDSSLAAGADAAYVLPFPLLDPASCRSVPSLPAGTTIEPLVDTRQHLLIRRGAARVIVDGDGVPRVVP